MDLKGYFLGELAEAERRAAEAHVRACGECREELERLEATRAALAALPEEEPQRRIAFVSDKIFEPRWWQRFWRSGPQLGFASAAMLAAAILAHALLRPASTVPPPARAVDAVAIEARVQDEVSRRFQAALEKAAVEAEARQSQRTAELVRALERKFEQQRQADLLAVEESMDMMRKRWNVMYMASSELGGTQ